MQLFLRVAVVALALLPVGLPSTADASSSAAVHVTNILPHTNGMVLFYVDAPRTGAPACAGSTISWTIDATTAAGQTQAALLATALAAKLPIDVGGTGVCQYGGAESINFINVYR